MTYRNRQRRLAWLVLFPLISLCTLGNCVLSKPPEPVAAAESEGGPAGLRGFSPGGEIKERASSTTRHFRRPDGSVEAVIGGGAGWYEDETGEWRDIDTTVEAKGNGFASLRNNFKTVFPSDTQEALQITAPNGTFFTYAPFEFVGSGAGKGLATSPAAGKAAGSRILYSGVLPNAEEEFEVTPTHLKHNLVLKGKPAWLRNGEDYYLQNTITVPPSVQLFVGEEPVLYETALEPGQVFRFVGAGDSTLFEMPVPIAFEAEEGGGPRSASGAVFLDMSITPAGGGEYLVRTHLPAAWLNDPERRYPVVIDPTVVFTPPVKDTFINRTIETINYGLAPEIEVGNGGSKNTQRRALLYFDVTSIPTTATVTNVQLELYVIAQQGQSRFHEVYKLTQDWVEGTGLLASGADWDTYDGINPWAASKGGGDYDLTVLSTVSTGSKGVYEIWYSTADFIAAVQDWVTTPANNVGLIVRDSVEDNSSNVRRYNSRNGSPTEYPILRISYTGCPVLTCGSITVTPGTPVCLGTEQLFSASYSGGEAPTTVDWDFDFDGITFDLMATGETDVPYTYPTSGTFTAAARVTDSCSSPSPQVCVITDTTTVLDVPTTDVLPDNPQFCSGGSVVLDSTPSGGLAPYTFLWSPGGETTQTILVSPTVTAAYSVTVTDSNGCSATSNETVDVLALVQDILPDAPLLCEGNTVTLGVSPLGGVAPHIFLWSPGGQITQSITVAPFVTTVYSVTVTDWIGCSTVASETVTFATKPATDILPNAPVTCAGDPVNLDANSSLGTPPYSYQWTTAETATQVTPLDVVDGLAVTDLTLTTLPNALTAVLSYTLTHNGGATDEMNCAQVTLIAPDLLTTTILKPFGVADAGSYDIEAFYDANGPGVYQIQLEELASCSIWNATLTGGTLDLTKNEGTKITETTTQVADPLDVTDGFEVSDFTPATTLLPAGKAEVTYTLAHGGGATDEMNCTQVILIAPDGLTTTVLKPFGVADVLPHVVTTFYNINGVGVYKIRLDEQGGCGTLSATLSGGALDITLTSQIVAMTPSTDTTYYVTVTDSNGCTASSSETVFVLSNVTASILPGSPEVCLGVSATLDANPSVGTPPYTYLWDTGETTQTITVTPGVTTSYSVTVTDSLACSDTDSATVTVNASVTTNILPDAPTVCSGGSITLDANPGGGTPPYTYAWNTGQKTRTVVVTPSATATYSVTVTDTNGCFASSSELVTVSVNPAPTTDIQVSGSTTICLGDSRDLDANPAGGTPPYTYLWTTSETVTQVADPLDVFDGAVVSDFTSTTLSPASSAVLSYTLTHNGGETDETDCAQVTLIAPDLLTTTILKPFGVADAGSYDIKAFYNANGAGVYQIQLEELASCSIWNATLTAGVLNLTKEGTSQIINVSPAATTTYTVTVTDSLGCFAWSNETITVSIPLADVIPDNPGFCAGASITLNANPSAGTPPYTYSWDTGATTQTITVAPAVSTMYTVTVTDSAGCIAVSSETVAVNPIPSTDIIPDAPTLCYGTPVMLDANPTGGTAPFTFVWSPGDTRVVQLADGGITVLDAIAESDFDPMTTSTAIVAEVSYLIIHGSGATDLINCVEVTLIAPDGFTTLTLKPFGVAEASPYDVLAFYNTHGSGTYTLRLEEAVGCGASFATLFNAALTVTEETPGPQTWTVTPILDTTYSVTVTDVNGCQASSSETVTVYPDPGLNILPDSPAVCKGNIVTLDAGVGFLSYHWTVPEWAGQDTDPLVAAPELAGQDTDPLVAMDGILVSDLAPDTTLMSAISATLSYTLFHGGGAADVTSCTEITLIAPDGLTTTTLKPFGVADGGFYGVTAFYNANGPGTYQIQLEELGGCGTLSATLTGTVLDVTGQVLVSNLKPTTLMPAISAMLSYTLTHGGGVADVTDCTEITLIAPDGLTTTTLKLFGVADLGLYDVTAFYNANGPGTYQIQLEELDACSPWDATLAGTVLDLTAEGVNFEILVQLVDPLSVMDATISSDFQPTTFPSALYATVSYSMTHDGAVGDDTLCTEVTLIAPDTVTTTTLKPFGVADVGFYDVTAFCNANGPGTYTIQLEEQTLCGGTGSAHITEGVLTVEEAVGDSQMLIVIEGGDYVVTVGDALGCFYTDIESFFTSHVNAQITPNSPTICGAELLTLTAKGSNGVPPYAFLWSTGEVTTSIVVAPTLTTTYTVTVTDAIGCVGAAEETVMVSPDADITPDNPTICQDTSVTLSVSVSGDPPFTYLWSTGEIGKAITVSPAATLTYSVTVTDDFGCIATEGTTVTVIPRPGGGAIMLPPVSSCLGNTTTFIPMPVGGLPPYAYIWDFTNDGITDSTLFVATYTYPLAGNYTWRYRVTDANGCFHEILGTVLVSEKPTTDILPDVPTICSGASITLDSNPLGGIPPYTYAWNTGAITRTIIVAPSATSTYTVTVTDSKGCFTASSETVTVSPNPAPQTDILPGGPTNLCIGDSVTLDANPSGGTPPYSFLWSPGAETAQVITVSPSITTTYTVAVTDSLGCTVSSGETVTVLNPVSDIVPDAPVICFGDSVLLSAVPAGGTPPYSYLWSPGGEATNAIVVSPPAGTTTYSVAITDAIGCVSSSSETVTVNTNPSMDILPDNPAICAGDSVTFDAGAGFSYYEWVGPTLFAQKTDPLDVTDGMLQSKFNSTFSAPALSATVSYTLTHGDGAGGVTNCTQVTLIAPDLLTTTTLKPFGIPDIGSYDMLAFYNANGAGNYQIRLEEQLGCGLLNATLTDGVMDITGTVGTFQMLTVSPPVTSAYSVTVTDVNGCQALSNETVTVYPGPVPVILPLAPYICLGDSVVLDANPTDGVPPYTYLWNTGATTQTITASPAFDALYTVTVTDSQPCTVTTSRTVSVSSPSATISPKFPTICLGYSVTLTAQGKGGLEPYTYLWSTGATSLTITVTPAVDTPYTLTVTDVLGCVAVDTTTVYVVPDIVADILPDTPLLCSGGIITLTANASGGTLPYTYLWNTGSTMPSITMIPLTTATFTVTVSDQNGCTVTVSELVTVNATPEPNVLPNPAIICPGGSIALNANPTGGTPPYFYIWNPTGEMTQIITVSPAATTMYGVTVTDLTGCKGSQIQFVTVSDPMDAVTTVAPDPGCVGQTTVFTSTPSGGTPPYTFEWDYTNDGLTDATTQTASVAYPAASVFTWRYRVTDLTGCFFETTGTLTIDPSPAPSILPDLPKLCAGGNVTLDAGAGFLSYEWVTTESHDQLTDPLTVVNDWVGSNFEATTVFPALSVNAVFTLTHGGGVVAVTDCTLVTLVAPDGITTAILKTYGVPDAGVYDVTAFYNTNGPGTYEIRLREKGGCGASSAIITAGSLDVTAVVGTGQTLLVTSTGTYTVTVTNAFSCIVSDSETVSITSPVSDILPDGAVVCSAVGVLLDANPSGGLPPYTYLWNTGATTPTITVTPPVTTIYSVTVTDFLGCTGLGSETVNVSIPAVDIIPDAPTICSGATITLDSNPIGGTPPYTYLWSTDETTRMIDVSPPTTRTYTVTVTDALGCIVSAGETVYKSSNSTLTSDMLPDTPGICSTGSVTLDANPIGGTPPFTYLWSPGGETTQTINVSPPSTTVYFVSVTDSLGCTASSSETLGVGAPLSDVLPNAPMVCAGVSIMLDANPSSGTPPYTYSWNTGDTTATITVTPAVTTTYTVTVTDLVGCTAVSSETVAVYPNPAADVLPNNPWICEGDSIVLDANPSGGAPPYAFLWNTGEMTQTITVTPPVTLAYSVTVTDSVGCIISSSETVTLSLSTPVILPNPAGVCLGNSIVLDGNPTGGTPPYTYLWDTGATTRTITVSPATTTNYTVIVTDFLSCVEAGTRTVTVSDPLAAILPVAPSVCTGASITLDANPTNGIPPYTYLWNTGETLQAILASPVATKAYSVTVTDSIGCTVVGNTTVTVNPSPAADILPDNPLLCSNDIITLDANPSGGTPPYTYFWSGGKATRSITEAIALTTTFTVTVTDSLGCRATSSETVTVSIPEADIQPSAPIICIGDSVTLDANPVSGTPPYSYIWSNGKASKTINVSPAVTTVYDLILSDATGCPGYYSVTVTVSNIVSNMLPATSTWCSGQPITLNANPSGGIAPYTFLWNAGNNYISELNNPISAVDAWVISNFGDTNVLPPLASAEVAYALTHGGGASDVKSCTQVSLTAPDGITTATLKPFGAADAGLYDVAAFYNVNGKGTYRLELEEMAACGSFYVANISKGTLTLTEAPSTAQNLSVTPLTSTTYSVTITDSAGCSIPVNKSLTVYPSPVVNIVPDSPFRCPGAPTTLDANPLSGTPPYTFLWSTGATTQSIMVAPAATTTYFVTVTDSKACAVTESEKVTVSDIEVDVEPDSPAFCQGGGPITLEASAQGGAPPYTYLWDTGETTPFITVNPASTTSYTVTVTDAAGCSIQGGETVFVSIPVADVIPDSPTACAGGSITLDANPSGGAAPYTYLWSTGETTQRIIVAPVVQTVYSVTITDSLGCTGAGSENVSVSANPAPFSDIQPDLPVICIGDPIILDANPSGGTPPYTFLWNPGGQMTQTISVAPFSATDYFVTVTDSLDCTASSAETVMVSDIAVDIEPNFPKFCFGETTHLDAMPTGGAPPYTFLWSTGETAQTIYVGVEDIYSVTVTDSAGCSASALESVEVNPELLTDIVPNSPIACLGGSFTLDANPSGGTPNNAGGQPPYTYLWNTGEVTRTINVAPVAPTTYTVTVTDDNGCTASSSEFVDVSSFQPPTTDIIPDNPSIACLGLSVTLDANPGGGAGQFDYFWSTFPPGQPGDGATTRTITVSPDTTSTYSVAVTDNKGCTATSSELFVVETILEVHITPVGGLYICLGGKLRLKSHPSESSVPPHTFLWSTDPPGLPNDGSTAQHIWVAVEGTYTVVATDALGCSGIDSATVVQLPDAGPSADIVPNAPTFCGGESVTLTVIPSGGIPPYTYEWSTSPLDTGTTITVSPLVTTTYEVIVWDAHDPGSCAAYETETVYVNPDIYSDIIPNSPVICAGSAVTFDANPSFGTPPYTYEWNIGANTRTITVSTTGTYSVIVTDAGGCIGTSSETVTSSAGPAVFTDIVPNVPSMCFSDSVVLDANPLGGTAPYSFLWNTGEITQVITVSPTEPTTYTVDLTDVTGCTDVSSEAVSVLLKPAITFSESPCTGLTRDLSITPVGGLPPYTYFWNTGAITQTITVLGTSGPYLVEVTDANGCSVVSSPYNLQPCILSEPSDVDISPLDPPLLVVNPAGTQIMIEKIEAATAYNVFAGLFTDFAGVIYDTTSGGTVCTIIAWTDNGDGTVTLDYNVPDNSWIAVSAAHGAGESSVGRDSVMVERRTIGTWQICPLGP